MVEEYKNTQGYCCFYWERNNYGLWDGAETDIPLEDRESTIRAHALYKLLIKR
jgi:hypothetical protein